MGSSCTHHQFCGGQHLLSEHIALVPAAARLGFCWHCMDRGKQLALQLLCTESRAANDSCLELDQKEQSVLWGRVHQRVNDRNGSLRSGAGFN